jgi:hypothetical protein
MMVLKRIEEKVDIFTGSTQLRQGTNMVEAAVIWCGLSGC